MSEFLPVAVRAFTERARPEPTRRTRGRGRRWRPPARVLVLDCETETHAGQPLSLGSYRYCRLTNDGRLELIEEGLFHADDFAEHDPAGLSTLETYAADHGLPLLSRRVFVERVFWRCAFKARAWVVGFNLPFDLSRLAVSFGAARGDYLGGHSLVLWDHQSADGNWVENRYRPRLQIKALDSKRAFIGFSGRRDPDPDDLIPDDSLDGEPDPSFRFRGHFLDLRTLAFALTNQSHSLASACETFAVEEGKLHLAKHGEITPAYIDYNRRDVAATGSLLEKLLAEYRRHPIALMPTKAYSPASIAKAYLKALGVQPLLERQPDFPRQVLGAGMVGYYGGRAECRIRRTPLPVVYVDFLSMYATVNTLMHAWRLLTADRVELIDATDMVRELLSSLTLEQCFDPAFWPGLLTLVQIKPDRHVLPVRADYGENGQWQIGNNPLTSDTPLWYTLADVVAAALRSPTPPEVIRAVQLVPVGEQDGLRPVRLGGGVEIDPARADFFATVIEQRKLIQRNTNLPQGERERLSAFLKVLANSGCYGIFAEINSTDLGARSEPVTIHGLFDPFTQRMRTVEAPGSYSFPPLAACITAAARLMLAFLERVVTDAGGNWVFCDTDSMAVVATRHGGTVPCRGGPLTNRDDEPGIHGLSWEQIDEIIERFTALNPYDPEHVPGSLLELEKWNLDADRGERLQLYCYAISAKRYALYNLDDDRRPILRKPSEHGLGHLLNPTDPDGDDRDWISQLWQRILDDVHGTHDGDR
jgi:hypothetical protein